MNFFEQQEKRRKKTRVLILLFVLAVAATVTAVYGAATLFWFLVSRSETALSAAPPFSFWSPLRLFWVTSAVVLLVGGGSLYMRSRLSNWGNFLAERLGGRRVDLKPEDPNEARLRNVIEEMAIASGIPVPRIFLLENEVSINALAAGYGPTQAVVGITRGAIERLNRDELQGVVAHEFSHILNGDMRLNMHLLATLHGILLIGLTGRLILRSSGRKRGTPALVFLGLSLAAIGWIGLLFGRLIKSAVSREREYLADASAVQFTRNPAGIAGALKKIGGYRWGSKVAASHAEEMSHMFIANALGSLAGPWMATHPPLRERIRLIDPAFDGRFPEIAKDEALPGFKTKVAEAAPPAKGAAAASFSAAFLLNDVGLPKEHHLSYARRLISSLPPELADAAKDPNGAAALVYALLIGEEESRRPELAARLKEREDPEVCESAFAILEIVEPLGRPVRLPLIDLSLPALRRLPRARASRFLATLGELIRHDGRVSLWEFTLVKILKRHLIAPFRGPKRRSPRHFSLGGLASPCSLLLSAVANAAAPSPAASKAAFERGAVWLLLPKLEHLPREACTLLSLERALDELRLAVPMLKQRVLQACVAVATSDRRVDLEEAEMIRAVAEALECPVPPLLAAAQEPESAAAIS